MTALVHTLSVNNLPPLQRGMLEQNRGWLRAYFLATTGDRDVADDLVQETFVIALDRAASYNPELPFGAWLRGIARNVLRTAARQHRVRPLPLSGPALDRLDALASQAEQEGPNEQDRQLSVLRDCLSRLGSKARRLIQLRYSDAASSQAIAGQVGMSVAAVDMAMSRARQALRDCVSRKAAGGQP